MFKLSAAQCLNFQLLRIRIPNVFDFHRTPPLRLFHLDVLQPPAHKHLFVFVFVFVFAFVFAFHLDVLQPPAHKHHPPFQNNLTDNLLSRDQIL